MPFVDAKSRLAAKMNRGQKPFGIFVSSIDPAVTDVLGAAGFDFLLFDGEHGRIGRLEIENHVRAAAASGTVPFVRILENSPTLIQSVLDVGAQGVVVPHVDTADEAAAAVAASRYAPHGRRGMCPACHAGGYTLGRWGERVAAADDNVMVIPIIESRLAVDNIESILAVDGIDIVHFGPGDLSADMGIDFSSGLDFMTVAWRRCLDACRAAGKRMLAPSGFGYDGADMLVAPMELMLLRDFAAKMVADHRTKDPKTVRVMK